MTFLLIKVARGWFMCVLSGRNKMADAISASNCFIVISPQFFAFSSFLRITAESCFPLLKCAKRFADSSIKLKFYLNSVQLQSESNNFFIIRCFHSQWIYCSCIMKELLLIWLLSKGWIIYKKIFVCFLKLIIRNGDWK